MNDKTKQTDNIYAQPQIIKAFEFDQNVVQVFSDMIARSVPGYGMTLDMIAVIAKEHGKAETNAYDLGCSLGAATLSLRHHLPEGVQRIVAVDTSKPMLDQFSIILQKDKASIPVDLVEADICDIVVENASIAVMNFTLQFIALEKREALLANIANGLVEGGALVLSEKIYLEDEQENEEQIALHHQFKQQQGYSQMEIAQKREALENVLIPETIEAHKQRLYKAGFSKVYVWFQCFNFVSFIAIK